MAAKPVRALVVLLAILIGGLALAGVRWRSSRSSNETAAAVPTPSVPEPSPSRDDTAGKAVEKFRADIKTASPRQWTILGAAALAPHERGEWDDYRVGSPVVMTNAGESRYRMWYVGCRFADGKYDCGVGHATSADGIDWTRAESPVFVPPDQPATQWLSTIGIVKTSDRYLMWYSIDGDSFVKRPRATLHLATSADGITWENSGPVLTTGSDKARSIKHAVCVDGRQFHLWYFDFPEDGAESLVHFTSSDGKTWTPAGGDTFGGRVARIGRPWVTSDGHGGFRALLADRRQQPVLRWLTSPDGTNWTSAEIERDLRVASDGTSIVDATALNEPGALWVWTTTAAGDRRTAESISVAFKKGSGS